MTNESLGRGGPGCTLATWQKLTGIYIDHFMMVDFAGVVSMADAIGGVPVCVDARTSTPARRAASGSGLKLKKGTHPVKGEQALQWLRTRLRLRGRQRPRPGQGPAHVHELDDARAEGRTRTLSSPNKLRRLAEAATEALDGRPTDLGTVKKLYDLGRRAPEGADQAHHDDDDARPVTRPDANRRRAHGADADQMFAMVRDDMPLDGKGERRRRGRLGEGSKDPAATERQDRRTGAERHRHARSGGRSPGGPSAIADAARRARASPGGDGRPTAALARPTVIRYPSADLEGDAQARGQGRSGLPLTSVEKSTDVTGITLVVGADWRDRDAYPASQAEEGSKAPESCRAAQRRGQGACMDVIQEGFTFSGSEALCRAPRVRPS